MRIRPIILAMAIPFALGCWQPAGASPGNEASLTPQARKQLAQLRSGTAIYHDITNARAMGFDFPAPPLCMTADDGVSGGMGYHYIIDPTVPANASNPASVGYSADPDWRYPQVMIYEPQKNGTRRFVGIEYVIPFAVRPESAEPPELFGQQFMPLHSSNGVQFDLWMLHVWLWRDNPNGMFAPWNPKVSCRYADDS